MEEIKKMMGQLKEIMEDESKKLNSVLGSCPSNRMEIRVFFLESYVKGMKADPDFDEEIYTIISTFFKSTCYSASRFKGESREELKRRMRVAKMLMGQKGEDE